MSHILTSSHLPSPTCPASLSQLHSHSLSSHSLVLTAAFPQSQYLNLFFADSLAQFHSHSLVYTASLSTLHSHSDTHNHSHIIKPGFAFAASFSKPQYRSLRSRGCAPHGFDFVSGLVKKTHPFTSGKANQLTQFDADIYFLLQRVSRNSKSSIFVETTFGF